MIESFTRKLGGFISLRRRPPKEFEDYPLLKDFQITGRFWLPTNENKISGIIDFKGGGPASLRLDGLLHESHEKPFREDKGIILGKLGSGAPLTILGYGGFVTTFGAKDEKNFKTSIEFDYLLIGKHFETSGLILLRELKIKFTHLDEWFDPPYEMDSSGSDFIVKRRTRGSDFKLVDQEEEFALRHFPQTTTSIPGPKGINIRYSNLLYITSETEKPLEWFLDKAAVLRNFFSFIIGRPVFTLDCEGVLFLSDLDPKIPIYFVPQVPENVVFDRYYFGIIERNVRSILSDLFNSWFASYRKYTTAYRLYLSLLYANGLHEETVFLNMTQAVEHLHKELFASQSTYFEASQWKKLKNSFLDNIPMDLKLQKEFESKFHPREKLVEFLKNKFGDMNRVTLRTRLDQMIEGMPPSFLGSIFIARNKSINYIYEGFAEEIADIRNSLTHAKPKNPLPASEELQLICAELWAILTYWLARQFISDEKILSDLVFKSRFAEFLVRFHSNL